MIEKALFNHLQEQEETIGQHLATYGTCMAIFNQEAPDDTDPGWGEDSQYGRLVFAVDYNEDPERIFSGLLSVDFMCESGQQIPEEVEPLVRQLIDGYFFSDQENTIAAQWSASNYFTDPTEKVIGVTLTFGLLAFPKQTKAEPDPIALLNEWTSTELPSLIGKEIRVIGYDTLEEAWKPTEDVPAIYWRVASTGPCNWIPDTYNCSWQTAVINGHVMSPDITLTAKLATTISQDLQRRKRLIFEDESPLMLDRNIRVNLAADCNRVGQIAIDGTYGILNIPPEPNPIKKITVREPSNDFTFTYEE